MITYAASCLSWIQQEILFCLEGTDNCDSIQSDKFLSSSPTLEFKYYFSRHQDKTMSFHNNLFAFFLILSFTTTKLSYSFMFPEEHYSSDTDPSICRKLTSKWDTRKVPYVETFMKKRFFLGYKLETRLNYKIEYTKDWEMVQVCCKGYSMKKSTYPIICSPICENGCIHGQCIAPNVCQCFTGYKTNDHSKCEPECENPCVNGWCSAPNICQCDPNYELESNGFICQPVCKGGCPEHAECTAPDTCVCNNGYQNNQTLSETVTASLSYSMQCQPVCSRECIHGDCVAPETCACKEGYKKDIFDDYTCVPICKNPCSFGTCTAPDNCTCFDGYEHETASLCRPVCSKGCVEGSCVAPEMCSCNDGFAPRENSTNVCYPVCNVKCINAVCSRPNTCTCNEGYEFDEINSNAEIWTCRPSCQFKCGLNGSCVAPNTCNCSEGYYLIDPSEIVNDTSQNGTEVSHGLCQPICNETCVNGKCIGPNVCECYDGYGLAENGSTSSCQPICENGCENGTCLGPNQCQCLEGFTTNSNEINASCIPVCDRNCSYHGVCVHGSLECQCYFGWSGADCDQPTVCVIKLNISSIDIDRVIISNETNSTILSAEEHLLECHKCMNSLSNESLCYNLSEHDEPRIACFIRTDMDCLMGKVEKAGLARVIEYGTYAGVLLVVSLIGVACIAFRKREKKHRVTVEQSTLIDKSQAAEILLETELQVD